MQFLKVKIDDTLTKLRDTVGASNVGTVLATNQLSWMPNIGAQLQARTDEIIRTATDVSKGYKIGALNSATQDSDVFEVMSMMGNSDWKVYKNTDALPGTIKIPDSMTLPLSTDTIGNAIRVSNEIYKQVMRDLDTTGTVNPSIFNDVSTNPVGMTVGAITGGSESVFKYFKIPWGKMSIYSSIADESKDFPVYPTEFQDSAKANYITMPEIIYQYEPWQIYTSSGPRALSYSFIFHRDMWTGDHRDGMANALVQFCKAQCYPEYNGSAVNTPLTTLYMNGEILIRGVITDVQVGWEGPLGLDNFPLVCKLQLSFIEVSQYPLNYWTVMNKPLIG